MKKSKLIRQVAVAFAIVFMSAVLCGAGCSNVASDSGGGSSGGSGASSTMTEAEAIAAIKALQSGGSITIKLGSSVKTISADLKAALKDANKKVTLDLSESGVDISAVVSPLQNALFFECLSLVGVKLPNGAAKIGSLFIKCSSLASVEIPSGVTSIDEYAFTACTSLTSVAIPSSVTSIGENAFSHCTSLTSVAIPSSVTSIGKHAFRTCTSLTSVEIPSSVTSIGEFAFGDCTSLTSVTIPDGVNISTKAFMSCTSLTTIKYAGTKNDWNTKITSFGDYWREYVPAKGVTCSDGKTYAFVGAYDSRNAADHQLGAEI